jgi:hypothetical protein
MKLQDKLNIGISALALSLSVGTVILDRESSSKTARKEEQKNIYDAYQLGQAAAIIYAYSHAGDVGAPAGGKAPDAVGPEEIGHWSAAAQAYSQSFNISPAEYIAFIEKVKTTAPANLSGTFDELDAAIQIVAGSKAVVAYNLGCQAIIFGIGTKDISDYSRIRDLLNKELSGIGIPYSLPDSVANTAAFVAALKAMKDKLDAIRP